MDFFIQNLIDTKQKVLINLHSLSLSKKDYWEHTEHDFYDPNKIYDISFSIVCVPTKYIIEKNIEVELDIVEMNGEKQDFLYHDYLQRNNLKKIKLRFVRL